jgi:hypothetical protein
MFQLWVWRIPDLCEFIIPGNQVISGFPGGTIGTYPYIYVEFEISENPTLNVLVSNNPNSNKAMFKVPVANDFNTTFYRLSSCVSPTVKFKPTDTFTIRVKSPNGKLLEWATSDTKSPFPPNPSLQVSMTIRAIPVGELMI